MQQFTDELALEPTLDLPTPTNGKAITAPPQAQPSAPSAHPTAKPGIDRTQFADPELSRPVGERQDSKQTILKIRKSEGKYFRVHPNPATRLLGVTVLVTKSSKVKVLTNAVTAEVRAALRSRKVLKQVNMFLACDEEGSYFICYFSASAQENAESWVESGHMVAQAAEREWVACEAVMSEGGYRLSFAKNKYPKLAASVPKWDLPGEDDPVQMFEAVIQQNMIESDNSSTIKKLLESRQ